MIMSDAKVVWIDDIPIYFDAEGVCDHCGEPLSFAADTLCPRCGAIYNEHGVEMVSEDDEREAISLRRGL